MDDLQKRFLPQFIDTARVRVQRALDAVDQRDPDVLTPVLRELHALAGEAGLLGLRSLMQLARDAEELAHRTIATQSPDDAHALGSALREIERGIDSVTPRGGS